MKKYVPLVAAFLGLSLAACNLTKDVEIELPEYERQPVVECYLEPGKPFRLLLSQSYGFFDPFGLDSTFLQKTLLQGAVVTISYGGQTDTLANQTSFELDPLKIFNYTGKKVVPATPGIEYTLSIALPDKRGNISGRATMLPFVPIDSVVVEFSPDRDTLARLLTYVTDDLSTPNFYRRLLNYSTLDSLPQQDFVFSDRTSTGNKIAFGTGYDLMRGDTAFNTIFHISREYYDYLESVQLAVAGNISPFAQPSAIRSNVNGSANPLGIFTCMVYDRKMTVVK
ncbi:MAG TPA: DUF4249 domain-containing protein [Saprospiraceae bacterium]|nr:DUF4249 domain-containing protein [Saprospiraceae bacterium]HNG90858.1 DUF4249 domain-containing protein [Saprospiraceae bacterium]